MVWFATTHALFILETSSVLITPVTILVLVFLETTPRARDSRDESRAEDDSRNEPSAFVDSRYGLCVEGDFQRDDETFLGVRKDDVTFSMFKQMVSPFLFLVRAQASVEAQSLLLDHVRINVGTWNWNQVMELSTTCVSHL